MDLSNFHFTLGNTHTSSKTKFVEIFIATSNDYDAGFLSSYDIPYELTEYLENIGIYELSEGYYEAKFDSVETLRKSGAIIHEK